MKILQKIITFLQNVQNHQKQGQLQEGDIEPPKSRGW